MFPALSGDMGKGLLITEGGISIYPACDYAIGYLTRGCPNRCRWCIVPKKEGNIRPYRAWQDLVRQDTDKLVLMDNNILACDYGVEQLAGLIGSGYRIDLNQGMDARLVTPEVADILAAAVPDGIQRQPPPLSFDTAAF